MKKQTAIDIKDLYFRYDKDYILKNINLKIYDKDFIAIIGPNGGGKTTFIKLILGLLKPSKGEIKIYGKDPQDFKEHIGYLPQITNFNIDIPINVLDIVLQGRLKKNKYFYNSKDIEICESFMKRLKIFELKNRKISQLSGGQRQKVLLARALVSNPKVLILDEPTASIDIEGQKEIYEIIKELDITKIVVSHDIKILFEGVNRVFYINQNVYIHENPKLSIKPDEGHFCEMELFDYLKNCHV